MRTTAVIKKQDIQGIELNFRFVVFVLLLLFCYCCCCLRGERICKKFKCFGGMRAMVRWSTVDAGTEPM